MSPSVSAFYVLITPEETAKVSRLACRVRPLLGHTAARLLPNGLEEPSCPLGEKQYHLFIFVLLLPKQFCCHDLFSSLDLSCYFLNAPT